MTPPTDFAAVHAMRAELTQLLGGKAQMLSYMVKNGASHMRDQFRIFGAELAKRGSSLTSAAPATAKPAAVPPTKPAAAPAVPKAVAPAKNYSFTPAKPAAPAAVRATATLTRLEFATLTPRDQSDFCQAGGKITN